MKAIEPYKRVISHGGQYCSLKSTELFFFSSFKSLGVHNFCNVCVLLSRLLRRWFECHNCICCVLYAREQSTKLQIHNGQFIQVSLWTSFAHRACIVEPTLTKASCFRYVIGTLELLVAENYMIVYLNGATSRKKMPSVGWLRKCYQQIDRRWVKLSQPSYKVLVTTNTKWYFTLFCVCL